MTRRSQKISKQPKGEMILIQRRMRTKFDPEKKDDQIDWQQVGYNAADYEEADDRLKNTLRTMRSRVAFQYRVVKVKIVEVHYETD